jgi:hypothetical protein
MASARLIEALQGRKADRHFRPSDIKELAFAPQPADGPADPWFRPVWEDGDDDPLPSPTGCPHARLRRPSRCGLAEPLRLPGGSLRPHRGDAGEFRHAR